MRRRFLIAGTLFGGLAVAAGAFGAHALQSILPPERLETFETAVRYQMYHALALLAVAWADAHAPSRLSRAAGHLFLGGILIFSGSLYLLVFSGITWLGAITPIGGAAFLAGWTCLLVAALRSRSE